MLSTSVARTERISPAVRRAARRRSRWPAWALAGGWAVQVLLRLWLFRYHTGPVANPDETGYLVAARWLAGGPGADFSHSTFYQGGYPLLLVPAYWLTSDPVMVYRLVAAIGSMAAATAFPLAYLVLRRLALGRPEAVALAFVAGLSPALLLFSGLALADAVLPTLVLGWLLATHDLARTGSLRGGVVAGALAGFATAVHLRGAVILAVYVLTVAALLVIRRPAGGGRRLAPRAGLVAWGAAGLVAAAGAALNGRLASAVYPGGARDLSHLLLSRLTTLDGQAWALSGAAGQLWYLIVGTWGLAGLGLAAAVFHLLGRGGPPARRVLAGTLLAATLGVAYASSAALPDEHRVGNYAYGRYLACVAVVWTLAGLAVLARTVRAAARRRTVPGVRAGRVVAVHAGAAAALMAVSGGVAAWYAGDRLRRYAFIAFDFPEVSFLSRTWDSLDMARASAAALGLLACLVLAALCAGGRVRGRWRTAPLVVVLAAVNVAFAAGLAPRAAPPAGPDWLPAPPPPGRVALDSRVQWNVWVPLTYRVWWTRLESYDGARQDPPAGACTAVVPPDAGAPPEGWTATGLGGTRQGWTSWSGPGCPRGVSPGGSASGARPWAP
ncbi:MULTISPECIES: hypothetical protein [unclassified Nonomuraea]|uniref:hypothetical protein n=1 Tax=unclassified Nonomuraea TaxID=2593643 RepID=UPI0033D7CC94